MFQVVFTSNPSDANGIRWSRLDISYSHYQTFQQLFLFSPAVLSLTLRQTKITLANQHFPRVEESIWMGKKHYFFYFYGHVIANWHGKTHIAMEKTFQWENSLFLWPLSIASCHSHQRVPPMNTEASLLLLQAQMQRWSLSLPMWRNAFS